MSSTHTVTGWCLVSDNGVVFLCLVGTADAAELFGSVVLLLTGKGGGVGLFNTRANLENPNLDIGS